MERQLISLPLSFQHLRTFLTAPASEDFDGLLTALEDMADELVAM
jgi:hypothetical protein